MKRDSYSYSTCPASDFSMVGSNPHNGINLASVMYDAKREEAHFSNGKSPVTSSADEPAERAQWNSKIEFFLSSLSFAVGLGNVWRFPYLVYQNGGGAFIIPYFLLLFVIGIPLIVFESALGQYNQTGPISLWAICPIFQGLGYAMFILSFLVCVYYNMIMAWSMNYIFKSFTMTLPWTHCNNSFNTDKCRDPHYSGNDTVGTVSASEEFFHKYILELSEGIDHVGRIRWETVGCMLLCWTIVFLALFRGVKSMGKMSYFTAIFPYFVLTAFFIRGITLEGAWRGIMFYITPQWDKLLDLSVWGKAAVQVFFALAPCWGCIITLSSYNNFHNNFIKDCLIVSIGNGLTSLYAGFSIFAIVGHMAYRKGVEVDEVVGSGPGLAFIAYPEAIGLLPFPPLWSILFFVMLLTLGMGTQFTLVETVVTSIADTSPNRLLRYKHFILLGLCCVFASIDISMCTQAGMYILTLMDDFVASYATLAVGVMEVLVICHIYGIDKFMDNMKEMLRDVRVRFGYWRFMFMYVLPISVSVILVSSLCIIKPSTYGKYTFPHWTLYLGGAIAGTPILVIPLVGIINAMRGQTTQVPTSQSQSKLLFFYTHKF